MKKLEIDRGGVTAFLVDQAGVRGLDQIYLHVK
jgi:hypothetical protein